MRTTTKLTRVGNSTGLALSREVLTAARLTRGDEVSLTVKEGEVRIVKSNDPYNRAMALGHRAAARYRHTFAALAK
jgi:putative addiction module antidote